MWVQSSIESCVLKQDKCCSYYRKIQDWSLVLFVGLFVSCWISFHCHGASEVEYIFVHRICKVSHFIPVSFFVRQFPRCNFSLVEFSGAWYNYKNYELKLHGLIFQNGLFFPLMMRHHPRNLGFKFQLNQSNCLGV